jgi:hypothetical protein
MASKVSISKRNERILHSKSGNRCALCKEILADPNNPDTACIGENAHIYGEKPDAARYDANQDAAFVNSEKNLIFLCCNCHKKIDTDISSYSPKFLFDLKRKHETWVAEMLAKESMNYTFVELEILAKYILEEKGGSHVPSSYELVEIEDKIKKNSLDEVKNYITMGLTNNNTIVDFLNNYPTPSFAKTLNAIMSEEYKKLKDKGLDSVTIFYELWKITSGNKDDFIYKAAGLGILSYFFEECEVFEK